jgi:UTP--glucose-1-phosphate uridylyltransferase
MASEEVQQAEVTFKIKLEAIALTAKDEHDRKEFNKEIDGIVKLFTRFLKNRKRVIDWAKIKPPPSEMVVTYGNIPPCPDDRMQELGKKLVVLKLNGGLGTTMGCTGPKSAIEVRNDLTFLDLTVQQIKV